MARWTVALAVGFLAIGLTGLLGRGPSVTTLLLPLAAALSVASLGDVIRRNAPAVEPVVDRPDPFRDPRRTPLRSRQDRR